MDGSALLQAFGTLSGPDCLRDILPKYGQRIKVYNMVLTTYRLLPLYQPVRDHTQKVCRLAEV